MFNRSFMDFIDCLSTARIDADNLCDYIPFVSTCTNLIDIVQKCFASMCMKIADIKANRYYSHLNNKHYLRCIVLLVPIFGNLSIGLYDFVNWAYYGKVGKAIASTKPIENDFTMTTSIEDQRKAHEDAKLFLKEELSKIGAKIDFVSHSIDITPELGNFEFKGPLDPEVFAMQKKGDVRQEILKDGQRSGDNLVVYGVASQYNGCEAPGKYTIPPGNAVIVYKKDNTQGPAAQLAFSPDQVELINCGGNLGFNGLCNVLDEETKTEIAHGYFTPSGENAASVIQQLRDNGKKIEYSCIANIPLGAKKVVHQILVSAPAFGEYSRECNGVCVEGKEKEEIQFLCALHAYRAQFENCNNLAKDTGKQVIFKPTTSGLGVFGNDSEIVTKAFYQAATEYQKELKENNVKVLFQIFVNKYGKTDKRIDKMAEELGLSEQ